MRKIWGMLRQHVREDFDWRLYALVALFLVICIWTNYALNLENALIDRHAGKPVRILLYFLLYSTAYYGGGILTIAFAAKVHLFRSPKFWLWSFAGLLILATNVGFPYNTQLVNLITDNPRLFNWAYRIVANLSNFLCSALPLFILAYLLKDRELFGVNKLRVDLSPYLQILMVLAPMIAIASFEPGFKNYYPSYKANNVAAAMNWPGFIPPLIYEIAYGLDFFNVEFMFRGFLVIGMSKVLGKEAILPMVCTYCFLHFGKPIGECVSSVFGGYVLGVVAFYTRNIWGGVMVHIGLAWMMEVAAFLQKSSGF